MSLLGYILLLSGWLLALAALLLLTSTGARLAFVLAALLVEILGLALLTQHYRLRQKAAP